MNLCEQGIRSDVVRVAKYNTYFDGKLRFNAKELNMKKSNVGESCGYQSHSALGYGHLCPYLGTGGKTVAPSQDLYSLVTEQ